MNRIVDITGSKTVPRQQPGVPNPVPTRMWEGTLFQMDGKTPESMFTWTDDGNFYGTAQGVSSPYDLVNLISSHEPEPQPEIEVPSVGTVQLAALLEQLQDNVAIAQKSLEEGRDTLGLIRFRAVEALSRMEAAGDDSATAQACLEQIVELVNAAIGEKQEVPA